MSIIYRRINGEYGASCDGCQDTGHRIEVDGVRFSVWSVHDDDECIAKKVNRRAAENAIDEDWRRTP